MRGECSLSTAALRSLRQEVPLIPERGPPAVLVLTPEGSCSRSLMPGIPPPVSRHVAQARKNIVCLLARPYISHSRGVGGTAGINQCVGLQQPIDPVSPSNQTQTSRPTATFRLTANCKYSNIQTSKHSASKTHQLQAAIQTEQLQFRQVNRPVRRQLGPPSAQ